MADLYDMTWVELKKAVRSRIPLWTALGSLFMPLGIGFLIFVSRNPAISRKLGLVSAKADLMAYAGTDWSSYLEFSGMMIAAGGFVLFVIAISWVFGREFADGTVKDLLAVPVPRSAILMAKFIVASMWSGALAVIVLAISLGAGWLIGLPQGSPQVVLAGTANMAITCILAIAVVFPFAFFASAGRGYLLPLGLAVLALMMGNLVAILGWGEYFPWAVPGLFAQGSGPLTAASYLIVLMTGATGILGTHLWWAHADQAR
jgi:ABC-2 type transport system permease protein